MKNRRGKKPGNNEEWDQRAQAIVDRPASDAHDSATPAPRRKTVQRLRDRAREEWTKWAEVVVDHLAGVEPEAVSSDDVTSPLPPEYTGPSVEKPGRGEWIKWAQVVVDRLTTCVNVYSKPPHEDVFMSDKERQEKNGKALALLRRIHALTDDADTPTDSLTELEHHDERVIAGLKVLLGEMLTLLPALSADMQKLLKSSWLENCNGRLADELFRGPLGHEPEGIGSGYPEHGRLPESLRDLLEREQTGQGRHPRDALPEPHANVPRWHDDVQRRWADRNTQSLRSAGRVE